MGLAEELWRANQHLARACLEHPFVQGIASGELALERFRVYVGQDAYFLDAFTRAYALLLAKSPDREGLLAFKALLDGALEELRLHQGYAQRWGVDLQPAPAPATSAYTDFLLRTAALEPVGHGVAAQPPCMRLYAYLGAQPFPAPRGLGGGHPSPVPRGGPPGDAAPGGLRAVAGPGLPLRPRAVAGPGARACTGAPHRPAGAGLWAGGPGRRAGLARNAGGLPWPVAGRGGTPHLCTVRGLSVGTAGTALRGAGDRPVGVRARVPGRMDPRGTGGPAVRGVRPAVDAARLPRVRGRAGGRCPARVTGRPQAVRGEGERPWWKWHSASGSSGT